MRVHLIKQQTIKNYVADNMRSKSSFGDWLSKLKAADWKIPKDIQKTFNTADLLGKSSHRVVFDIGGNNYRIICKYAFGETEVHLFVCWIGTHAEYNKLCNANEQYRVNVY
jgi:mRNA interferase HigB